MNAADHINYMTQALQLAELGRFSVSPNPMVGCILVKHNAIVGQGYHQRAGEPHAEIHALHSAGTHAQGSTAYITLEPCCHQGRTPPCTAALIKAGIKKVYVATLDPNPLIAGKGIAALNAAGIEVKVGLLETEAQQLNEIFFHYITHKRPFVIAKWAMSLDGKTITHPNDTRDISSTESQLDAHTIRQQVDAILIGAKTAIQDNPQLTVRNQPENTKQPIRIVLSTHGNLPLDLKLFDSNMPAKTIVATTNDVDKDWCKHLAERNIEVIIMPKNKSGLIDLPTLLEILGKREITSVLVEGGRTIHESFFAENLVNKIHVYLAPVFIGSSQRKQLLKNIKLSHLSRDFHFIANPESKIYV